MTSSKKVMVIAVVGLSLLTAACSPRANSVRAVGSTSNAYDSLSCSQIRSAVGFARDAVASLSAQQNSAANADAIGVLFTLVPVGNVAGLGVEADLAEAKGRLAALKNSSIKNNC